MILGMAPGGGLGGIPPPTRGDSARSRGLGPMVAASHNQAHLGRSEAQLSPLIPSRHYGLRRAPTTLPGEGANAGNAVILTLAFSVLSAQGGRTEVIADAANRPGPDMVLGKPPASNKEPR